MAALAGRVALSHASSLQHVALRRGAQPLAAVCGLGAAPQRRAAWMHGSLARSMGLHSSSEQQFIASVVSPRPPSAGAARLGSWPRGRMHQAAAARMAPLTPRAPLPPQAMVEPVTESVDEAELPGESKGEEEEVYASEVSRSFASLMGEETTDGEAEVVDEALLVRERGGTHMQTPRIAAGAANLWPHVGGGGWRLAAAAGPAKRAAARRSPLCPLSPSFSSSTAGCRTSRSRRWRPRTSTPCSRSRRWCLSRPWRAAT